jgi:hypothetical protein
MLRRLRIGVLYRQAIKLSVAAGQLGVLAGRMFCARELLLRARGCRAIDRPHDGQPGEFSVPKGVFYLAVVAPFPIGS